MIFNMWPSILLIPAEHVWVCNSSACKHRRLATVVSSVLGNQVPVTVTALEAMARLLGVLEEVNHDTRLVVYEPVMLKLTSACAAVRHQVLRLSDPRCPMLGYCLHPDYTIRKQAW